MRKGRGEIEFDCFFLTALFSQKHTVGAFCGRRVSVCEWDVWAGLGFLLTNSLVCRPLCGQDPKRETLTTHRVLIFVRPRGAFLLPLPSAKRRLYSQGKKGKKRAGARRKKTRWRHGLVGYLVASLLIPTPVDATPEGGAREPERGGERGTKGGRGGRGGGAQLCRNPIKPPTAGPAARPPPPLPGPASLPCHLACVV